MTTKSTLSPGDTDQGWAGPSRRYDFVKEGVIAVVIVSVMVVLMAGLLGSPDEPQLKFKGWATSAPADFYATTVKELAGTSDSASYGPPYNTANHGLSVGGLAPQEWLGVTHPVDPANDFVITPLSTHQQPTATASALNAWAAGSSEQRSSWATTYDTALSAADGDVSKVIQGEYGPVPLLAEGLTKMASSGALDGDLNRGSFYQTDFTNQILFLGDGSYLDDAATAAHLQGNTWGMMNETGNYPGQAWLWLYSFWYQIPQFNSDNPDAYLTSHADAIIFYIMAALSLGLLLLPFIPGLRSIPRWIPVHRLIWRHYYHSSSKLPPAPAAHTDVSEAESTAGQHKA